MADVQATIPGSLVWGHGCFAVCAVLYLVWWWIFFNPSVPKATGALYAIGVGCIAGAALFGIGAIALIVTGLGTLSGMGSGGAVPAWAFAVGGVVMYAALAFVTVRFFQRQVTTELLLFVLWATLELAVASALADIKTPASGMMVVLAVLIVLVFIGCLVSYILYFHLPPMPSFVDGALPLLAVGIFAAIMTAAIKQL